MDTLRDILQLLKDGGVTALVLLILVAGWKRWWMWGWQYDDILKDRDAWKLQAMSGTHLAEQVAAELRRLKAL